MNDISSYILEVNADFSKGIYFVNFKPCGLVVEPMDRHTEIFFMEHRFKGFPLRLFGTTETVLYCRHFKSYQRLIRFIRHMKKFDLDFRVHWVEVRIKEKSPNFVVRNSKFTQSFVRFFKKPERVETLKIYDSKIFPFFFYCDEKQFRKINVERILRKENCSVMECKPLTQSLYRKNRLLLSLLEEYM